MRAYENLLQIVSANATLEQRQLAIRGFAEDLFWRPSYELRGNYGAEDVVDHLVVEHGLENAAAISFVRSPSRASQLDQRQIRDLLSLSYNNLIEWHIFVSEFDVRIINNRSFPDGEERVFIDTESVSNQLSGENFDRLRANWSHRRTQLSCDDAILSVLSRWKRILRADVGEQAGTSQISSLFNAIIFVRGCEDQASAQLGPRRARLLVDSLAGRDQAFVCSQYLQEVLSKTGVVADLQKFVELKDLDAFDGLDRATALNMFKDFYRLDGAQYDFNFALMSKHALSRIYEKYVSQLEFDSKEEAQTSFFKTLPSEQGTSKSGSVYTPQYVASFVARYIEANVPPRIFRQMRAIDPACGSGIFLRNLLELQANPMNSGATPQSIAAAFDGIEGVDRDANACASTRLSLSLLHLVATNKLPDSLSIVQADAIERFADGDIPASQYDVVVANPPYVKLDHLTEGERTNYSKFLGASKFGRVDAYLAFVKLCLQCVKPGGYVALVLPQAFLSATNAKGLRQLILSDFEVRCLVDLSAIEVFEGVGAYTVVLIVERRRPGVGWMSSAQIARVQDGVGPALQACLDRRSVSTPYYQVYEVDQDYFNRAVWSLLSPREVSLEAKLSKLKPLSHYMTVRQGFVSGLDKVFIRDKSELQKNERAIWADFLPDRLMKRYAVPKAVESAVFMPFEGDDLLSEDVLKKKYPDTWAYLVHHRPLLIDRAAVRKGTIPWWKPERPRTPSTMLAPKIVCPHLMLMPRFGVDEDGAFAVSHSPIVMCRDDAMELSHLKFFAAVLNSSVVQWYMSSYSPKYSRGYNRVEVALLRDLPVPDPAKVHPGELNALLEMVDAASKGSNAKLDREINLLIERIYQIDPSEAELLWGGLAQ